ncbi:MAG: exodeoxyribonuclease VII small subunit [Anaerolineales bacterium]|nr:exodeoxyribonuclease VII small subunit [Anaerolineales bacterium]
MTAKSKSKSKTEVPLAEMTFEQAFEELEALVEQLEAGQLPLEESLALFERGQALAARCGQLLDSAELKVKQLVGEKLEDFEAET